MKISWSTILFASWIALISFSWSTNILLGQIYSPIKNIRVTHLPGDMATPKILYSYDRLPENCDVIGGEVFYAQDDEVKKVFVKRDNEKYSKNFTILHLTLDVSDHYKDVYLISKCKYWKSATLAK